MERTTREQQRRRHGRADIRRGYMAMAMGLAMSSMGCAVMVMIGRFDWLSAVMVVLGAPVFGPIGTLIKVDGEKKILQADALRRYLAGVRGESVGPLSPPLWWRRLTWSSYWRGRSDQ